MKFNGFLIYLSFLSSYWVSIIAAIGLLTFVHDNRQFSNGNTVRLQIQYARRCNMDLTAEMLIVPKRH